MRIDATERVISKDQAKLLKKSDIYSHPTSPATKTKSIKKNLVADLNKLYDINSAQRIDSRAGIYESAYRDHG